MHSSSTGPLPGRSWSDALALSHLLVPLPLFCPFASSPHRHQPPLNQLAEDADLHVRELAFAARQYAVATADNPTDYDALYNHGLVLQELSGRLPAGSAEQAGLLRQVGTAFWT